MKANKNRIVICPWRNVECPLYEKPDIGDIESCPVGIRDESLIGGKACAFKIIGIAMLRTMKQDIIKESMQQIDPLGGKR